MPRYDDYTKEVPLTLNLAEIKAIRVALAALKYNYPGASTAEDKLRVALKAVAQ